MNTIDPDSLCRFERHLALRGKAPATIRKYLVALRHLSRWLAARPLSRDALLSWRDSLLPLRKAQSINGDICAVNAFLAAMDLKGEKIPFLRVQRRAFVEDSRELSEAEYKRLLLTAEKKGDRRMHLLMMTLASTGIRISELRYITVRAVQEGKAQIHMKGKFRTVLLPRELCRKLQCYLRSRSITEGPVFRTRTGLPMDRANICHAMKKLCAHAHVSPGKVFPHNFRHLFARAFFAVEKNLAHLADVLGHSRIETTRIYVAVSASAHQKILSKMRLII